MWLSLAACRPPKEPDPTVVVEHSATLRHTGHGAHHSGSTEPTDLPEFDGPLLLSEAGLYDDLAGGVLAPGVVPTTPRYPLWSDGSEKQRWLRVPAGGVVDTADPDHWAFPVGTLAFKEFVVDGERLETRRLEKREDGWDMVAYLWRADGTDADAVPEGVPDARGTTHDVPDRETCFRCHDGPADLVLGVDAVQLDVAGQALLPLTAPVDVTVPGDLATSSALGYLHGNCGGCHRAGALAGDRVPLWLDVTAGLADPLLANAVVTGVGTAARHEIGGASVDIVPGDPAASQLTVRMALRGLEGMPPVGSEVVDAVGVATVEAWVAALPAR